MIIDYSKDRILIYEFFNVVPALGGFQATIASRQEQIEQLKNVGTSVFQMTQSQNAHFAVVQPAAAASISILMYFT